MGFENSVALSDSLDVQRDRVNEPQLISYLILTGLVILLLHLTLYPFPSITKILNPHG